MRLAFNSYVYEVARWPIEKTLRSAADFGFKYIEYAACGSGDPTSMSTQKRKETVRIFHDLGLACAQMLLIETEHVASPDPVKRRQTLDYMKRCGEFLLELGGGRQVLICWGCGVHQNGVMPELTWVNAVDNIRTYAEWCLDKGILIDFEIEPHVYFVVNSTARAAQLIEDVGLPNLFPNLDIGHLCIIREGPEKLAKLRDKLLQIHLSETDTYEHTNSILGMGHADFVSYVHKAIELGIEENCARYGEPCVAGVELGSPTITVDDPNRWMKESLEYVHRILPELTF
ncbi:MAG: sugar phosphate isomerase/epimerase [Firmicutes bacterium]|nr:sugar phosphate isomerase/epimerase [Bacillota bacterium]